MMSPIRMWKATLLPMWNRFFAFRFLQKKRLGGTGKFKEQNKAIIVQHAIGKVHVAGQMHPLPLLYIASLQHPFIIGLLQHTHLSTELRFQLSVLNRKFSK